MIWHVIEIWLLLVLMFVAGCVLGSLVYLFVAETALARSQEVLADTLDDTIEWMKHRVGFTSSWRPQQGHASGHPRSDYPDYLDTEPVPRESPLRREEPPVYAGAAEELEPLHAGGAVFDEHLPEDEPVGDDWRQATVVADPDWQVEEAWDEDDMDVAAIPPPPVAPPQEPVPEPPVVEELPAMRPAGLSAPRNGVPDDLQRIRGIGKKNEALLNSLGIFHFGQIAAWTPAEIRWVGLQIKFPERIERDDWIGQATILASGGRTGYIKAEDRKRAEDEDDNYGPPG